MESWAWRPEVKPGDLSDKAKQVVEEPEVELEGVSSEAGVKGSSGTSGAGRSRDVGRASGENRNNGAGRISGRTRSSRKLPGTS